MTDISRRLVELLADELANRQTAPQAAVEIGSKVAARLAQEYGGERVYIPVRPWINRSLRDECIRREFTGRNLPELSRRWRLSVRRVREIVSE